MINFTKMHGIGNDFIVIDAISQSITITPKIAKKLGIYVAKNIYRELGQT
jgi:diaminopimelate epimerase